MPCAASHQMPKFVSRWAFGYFLGGQGVQSSFGAGCDIPVGAVNPLCLQHDRWPWLEETSSNTGMFPPHHFLPFGCWKTCTHGWLAGMASIWCVWAWWPLLQAGESLVGDGQNKIFWHDNSEDSGPLSKCTWEKESKNVCVCVKTGKFWVTVSWGWTLRSA